MKYYVSADVHRDATPHEIAEIGVPNACIHLYRVKTVVEAENVRHHKGHGDDQFLFGAGLQGYALRRYAH